MEQLQCKQLSKSRPSVLETCGVQSQLSVYSFRESFRTDGQKNNQFNYQGEERQDISPRCRSGQSTVDAEQGRETLNKVRKQSEQ